MTTMTNIPDEQLNNVNGGYNKNELLAKECPECHSDEHVVFMKDYDPLYTGGDIYFCKHCNCSFK